METQSRWKSPVFWGTVITSVVGILSMVGFWNWVGIEQDLVLRIVGALVTLASQILGSANNPTDPKSW